MRLTLPRSARLAAAASLFCATALLAPAAAAQTAPNGAGLPGFSRGMTAAPVLVLEFADFSCTYCAAFVRETMPRFQREAIATGVVHYVVVPMNTGVYKPGGTAGQAALCAARQDAFWSMHDRLYERQREWLGQGGQKKTFAGYARELGLDVARFEGCIDDRDIRDTMDRYTEMAQRCLVRGTPTFFINGRPLVGAAPATRFLSEIEAARAAGGGPRLPECIAG